MMGSYVDGFEVIDTRSIVLEEISKKEFRHREELWGDNRNLGWWDVCSKIINPVRDEVYDHLLYVLGKTSNVCLVDVREGYKWHKLFPGELTLDKCHTLAGILERDKFKRNFLDAVIGVGPNWQDWAIMEFGELVGEIIGYKLRVPFRCQNQFSMDAIGFNYNFGIWVPEPVAAHVAKNAE